MNPISLPVAELKAALTGISKVISKRTTLPVLGCVRIERTKTGTIEIAATDLNTSVVTRLSTIAQGEPRTLLVPYEELNNMVKGCGRDDTLLLSGFEKDKVAIKFPVGGNMIEHRCESFAVDEYPPLPEVTGEAVKLDENLRQGIRQAFDCASTDETRVILNGAYLDVSKPGAHYVVGTDGRHLFSSNSFALPLKESVIIPSHRFLGWKGFGEDGDWNLRVTKEKDTQQLEIATSHWRFITRGVDGNYPNWRQVIPSADQFVTCVEFDPAAVNDVIRTIAKTPSYDAINHGIGIEVANRKVSLLAKSAGADTWNSVPLPEGKGTGKDVKIFLNRKLLIKALRFGLTRIDVIDALSPLRFSEGGRQMIVMPIRPESTPARPVSSPAAPQAASTTPPQAEQNERNTMPETNGNNTSRSTPVEKPALDTALAQVEKVKANYRDAITGLNDLTALLKLASREQKASEKEVQSVRHTLRSLQSVRI